jgi:hypothetical protein
MITQGDFYNLVQIFAFMTKDGWQIPEWLFNWGMRLGFLDEAPPKQEVLPLE